MAYYKSMRQHKYRDQDHKRAEVYQAAGFFKAYAAVRINPVVLVKTVAYDIK
jgi:hypothetical protein